jgi:hypothetical protein
MNEGNDVTEFDFNAEWLSRIDVDSLLKRCESIGFCIEQFVDYIAHDVAYALPVVARKRPDLAAAFCKVSNQTSFSASTPPSVLQEECRSSGLPQFSPGSSGTSSGKL